MFSASRPTRVFYTLALVAIISACKHPLAIQGEGDIIDLNGNGFGCTLEQFQAGSSACENNVTGDYFANYSAVPRTGWRFSHWDGSCGHLTEAPNCRFDVPAVWVVYWDDNFAEIPIPPLTAVFVENFAPTADAGNDQTVNEQALITLDGTDSSDPEDAIASYSWSQTQGPSVELNTPNAASTTLTTPVTTEQLELIFELTVTDDGGLTAKDTVSITVNPDNSAPSANAGTDQSVESGAQVILAGSATDNDGTIVSYAWTQSAGTTVTLENADSATATFTAPALALGDVLGFQLTVQDNEGASASDTVEITVAPGNPAEGVGLIPLIFNDTPTQNVEVTLSLDTEAELGPLTWTVSIEPEGSSLVLAEATSEKSVTFTPATAGDYEIVVTSDTDSSSNSAGFTVVAELEFDENKIEGNEGGALDELIGAILNQVYVSSDDLDEAALRALVEAYVQLNIIGFDALDGLLVEYDETDFPALEAIEELKLTTNVDSVDPRTFTGEDADVSYFIPDDGDPFDDGGTNWHLEDVVGINAIDAWDITRGSHQVLMGVTDGGYFTDHEDLAGRFSHVLTDKQSSHGTAVAGIMGANSNNMLGMTGINHVSGLAAAYHNKKSYQSVLKQKNAEGDEAVTVINNSWGEMGNDSGSKAKGVFFTRSYRKLAKRNPQSLHVWAAGNDGADAITQNGGIHYNSFFLFSPRDNAMVVAAAGIEGILHHYSNFGESIDIAAPSEFLAASVVDGGVSEYLEATQDDYGFSFSGAMNGTSAAAPVVAGVASLISSLNPDFTGAEIKQILLDSATKMVTHRYTGPDDVETEELLFPVPMLDAAAAVQLAQALINDNVGITDSIPNPFEAKAEVAFNSIAPGTEIAGTEWDLFTSSDNDQFTLFSSMTETGPIAMPMLDTANLFHRLDTMVTVENSESSEQTVANTSHEFSFSKLNITARDTVNLGPLQGVAITIEEIDGPPIDHEALTSENGGVMAFLKSGTYKIYGSLEGFQDGVTTLTIGNPQMIDVDLNMTPDSLGAVGSISGVVVDEDNQPIIGASVRISGGAQTNGFFASATTDSNGFYVISNIAKTDINFQPIESFSLEASAPNFATTVRTGVIVLNGKERSENFTLAEQILNEATIFADGFENGTGLWAATGFWHIEDFSAGPIANTLVDGGFVSLAPDEAGPQALLPMAFEGNSAWWYGQPDTGTFIGTQTEFDFPESGGTSVDSNGGALVSPAINLSATNTPVLRFHTWWEIESVNPNEFGFDIMEILVSNDGGQNFNPVRRLNPFVDPNDPENRAPKPFSSAGHFRAPVWALEEVDLSEFAGQEIRIMFTFNTLDSLYNGFRGWIIDNLSVVDTSVPQTTNIQSGGRKFERLNRGESGDASSGETPEQTFWRVHKKPRPVGVRPTPTRQ